VAQVKISDLQTFKKPLAKTRGFLITLKHVLILTAMSTFSILVQTTVVVRMF